MALCIQIPRTFKRGYGPLCTTSGGLTVAGLGALPPIGRPLGLGSPILSRLGPAAFRGRCQGGFDSEGPVMTGFPPPTSRPPPALLQDRPRRRRPATGMKDAFPMSVGWPRCGVANPQGRCLFLHFYFQQTKQRGKDTPAACWGSLGDGAAVFCLVDDGCGATGLARGLLWSSPTPRQIKTCL